MTTIVYEWDCEEVADGDSVSYEDGEVIDHFRASTYVDVLKASKAVPPEGSKYRIVLVRDRLDKHDSVVCRSWAYLENGKLPEYFKDAFDRPIAYVPVKYHKEIKHCE